MATFDTFREAGNPLFNGNKLKLGTFSTNLSGACCMTTAETTFEPSFEQNVNIAKMAEASGIEFMLSASRWKGLGGKTNPQGNSMETYTWASALAAVTKNIYLFTTSNVQTIHPILAAKQLTTIDHISRGRIGLNIVSGWYRPELEMFTSTILDHDERYDYAAEWIDIVQKMWSEASVDYDGHYFKIKAGTQEPKPYQNPRPLLISAGSSKKGRDYAARWCDLNFSIINNLDSGARWVKEFKHYAWQNYKREVGTFTFSYVVCRDTEKEAKEYFDYYVKEMGDVEAADNFCRVNSIETSNFSPESLQAFREAIMAGSGGYPLIGTPEQIVEKLIQLSNTGIDGTLISFVDYNTELPYWNEKVMPLLVQAGLREPVSKMAPIARN